MLTHLSVQNYALIDTLEVDFSKGLTIITGETGAGKSILLGALGLVAGNRADVQALNDKTKKCVIEASFNLKEYRLQDFFSTNEIDYETVTLIRREINPEGKSRAFINDTPVTLNLLKELAEQLIDIHSQHQTFTINGSEFQLSVIDAYCKHHELLNHYHRNYITYKSLKKLLAELTDKELQAKKDADYFQFQFNELEDAHLTSNNQSELELELQALNNAEAIKLNLSKAAYGLTGGEQNLLSSLNEIKLSLASIAKYKPEIDELSERITSSYLELKDACHEIESLEQEIIYDSSRIEEITSRLDTLYRLQQKHQVNDVSGLIELKNELSNKLLEFSSLETEIEKAKNELSIVEKELLATAKKISANRKNAIPKIEKDTAALLASLSMPNAQLKIEQTSTDILKNNGLDTINFLFTANKGSDFKEIQKVASGGELSRLMLSIKSLIAQLTALPTIIFDEIDTGVSGEVADKVGIIMNEISKNIQVIAITHLPQIASKGATHLLVYKEDKNNKTYSNIKKLSDEERIYEIAKMLSTGAPSPTAIRNAEELLKINY
jgi:DNA repair protein RecN (Recombination protein N)